MAPCSKCGTDDRYSSGHCKECKRQYYEKNKERIKIVKAKYEANNKDKKKARKQRRRARKRNAPGSFTGVEWYELCRLYEFHCLSCGVQFRYHELTVDHVIPLSRGGTNYIKNIQPLCKACNSTKHAKHIDYRTTWTIPEEVILAYIEESREARERSISIETEGLNGDKIYKWQSGDSED